MLPRVLDVFCELPSWDLPKAPPFSQAPAQQLAVARTEFQHSLLETTPGRCADHAPRRREITRSSPQKAASLMTGSCHFKIIDSCRPASQLHLSSSKV